MKTRDLMQEFRLLNDGDDWGCTMSAWFDAAGTMYNRGLPIPDEWEYRPGITPVDPDSYWADILDEADDQSVTNFARILSRYADKLRAAGKNY